jgi:hypothetical protein
MLSVLFSVFFLKKIGTQADGKKLAVLEMETLAQTG